jgi:segregation and condensation protein A
VIAAEFELDLEVFTGPFDLLLTLVLREEVDLLEVELADIVVSYLDVLEARGELDLEVATEFLLIAATLVELKARRLLPDESDVDLDDELALWEERDLLLARLLECKTFKDVASVFTQLADEASRSFPRAVGADERFLALTPDLLEGTSVQRLRNAAIRALTPAPEPRVDLFHVTPIRLTVAEAVAELVDELPRVGQISFRRLTADLVERIEVIVQFLALLELFKQGYVDLDQADRFGDIEVTWIGGVAVDAEQLAIDVYEG